jgi:hypothetical protein
VTAFGHVFVLAISALGCATDVRPSYTPAADDTGLAVIELALPTADALHSHVLQVADLTVGKDVESKGGPPLFRVTAASTLSNGNVVVANAGTLQLLYYGPDGGFLRAVGKRGSGPGEFTSMGAVFRIAADSVLVHDGTGALTLLDAEGRVGGTGRIRGPAGSFISAVAMLDSVTLVIQSTSFTSRMPGIHGHARDTVTVALLDRRTDSLTVIGRYPGTETFTVPVITRGRDGIRIVPAPFARSLAVAAGQGRLHVGVSDVAMIRLYDGLGTPLAVLNGIQSPQRVGRREVRLSRRHGESGVNLAAAGRGDPRAGRLQYPATMPAFGSLFAGPSGTLWVERYAPPWAESDAHWDVHDGKGTWCGVATLAKTERLLAPGPAHVLVLHRDAVGREEVRRYPVSNTICTG